MIVIISARFKITDYVTSTYKNPKNSADLQIRIGKSEYCFIKEPAITALQMHLRSFSLDNLMLT